MSIFSIRSYASRVILAVFAVLVVLLVVLPLVGVALWFVVWTAVGGLVVGALGRLVLPGQQPIGVIATICCGWIGWLLGSGIAHAFGLHQLGTIVIGVAVSAAAVAVWSGTQRQVGGRRRRSLTRGA